MGVRRAPTSLCSDRLPPSPLRPGPRSAVHNCSRFDCCVSRRPSVARRRVYMRLEVTHSSPSVAGTTLVTPKQAPKCGPRSSRFLPKFLTFGGPFLLCCSSVLLEPRTRHQICAPRSASERRFAHENKLRRRCVRVNRSLQRIRCSAAPAGTMLRTDATAPVSSASKNRSRLWRSMWS